MKAKCEPISFIYFDLGSVLLPLDKQRTSDLLCRVSGLDRGDLYSIMVHDNPDAHFNKAFWGIVLAFDKGKIYPHEFYSRVSKQLRLRVDFDEFVKIWQSMLGVDRCLLAAIIELRKRGIRTGIISDLCLIHYNRFRELGLCDFFEISFFSFLEERLKREDDGITFAKAIAAAGLPPRNILFTDDRAINILAAERHGLRTHLYTNSVRFLRYLRRHGIKLN